MAKRRKIIAPLLIVLIVLMGLQGCSDPKNATNEKPSILGSSLARFLVAPLQKAPLPLMGGHVCIRLPEGLPILEYRMDEEDSDVVVYRDGDIFISISEIRVSEQAARDMIDRETVWKVVMPFPVSPTFKAYAVVPTASYLARIGPTISPVGGLLSIVVELPNGRFGSIHFLGSWEIFNDWAAQFLALKIAASIATCPPPAGAADTGNPERALTASGKGAAVS